jgi:tripartite-type tricarboxylate transporter receptor subunit TctC
MKLLPRREFLHLAAGGSAILLMPRIGSALDYPTRPVSIIVGYPAGLTPDIAARLIGQSLSERIGRQVVVENRPGGGGNIGTEAVVRAPPDGHTLLLAVSGSAINATLYANRLNFNFMRDIAPVAMIGASTFVMVVNTSVPAKTLAEFITYAKANPGKINMASPAIGTAPHVFGELFKMMTGTNMVHVPYRGSYVPDLLGGQVQVAVAPIADSTENIRAGKLRALAVTTATRSRLLPDIPTVGEFVPGYEAGGWEGIAAPRDTPAEIIDKLNKQINAVVADPDIKARLVAMGFEPMSMTSAEFGKFIADETERWGKVIRAANIKLE